MNDRENKSSRENLERLPTPELDGMLRQELEKEQPDKDTVRQILEVLRLREADFPVQDSLEIRAAWREYERKTGPKGFAFGGALPKVAAVVILCGLMLFAMPRQAQAENFFERIAAWSENVFELLDRWNRGGEPKEYVFRTDHPGLQELYDTVAGLGVTSPVVPMWLDGRYELIDCDVTTSPVTSKVLAAFSDGENEIVFELNIYYDSILREFHKNEADAEKYESNGVIHYVFRNRNTLTVVWTRDNLECSIFAECQEDELYQVLDSIYTMED